MEKKRSKFDMVVGTLCFILGAIMFTTKFPELVLLGIAYLLLKED